MHIRSLHVSSQNVNGLGMKIGWGSGSLPGDREGMILSGVQFLQEPHTYYLVSAFAPYSSG